MTVRKRPTSASSSCLHVSCFGRAVAARLLHVWRLHQPWHLFRAELGTVRACSQSSRDLHCVEASTLVGPTADTCVLPVLHGCRNECNPHLAVEVVSERCVLRRERRRQLRLQTRRSQPSAPFQTVVSQGHVPCRWPLSDKRTGCTRRRWFQHTALSLQGLGLGFRHKGRQLATRFES